MARGPIEPMPELSPGILEIARDQFLRMTYRHQDGHLIWKGRMEKVGQYRYPQWSFTGYQKSAARWAWHLLHAPIDVPNFQIVRKCDNERCVEPTHYEQKCVHLRVVENATPATVQPEKTWTPGRVEKKSKRVRRLRSNANSAEQSAVRLREERWKVTPHARERAEELGFTLDEVIYAAQRPEVAYGAPDHGPDAFVYQRGDIALGVIPKHKVVQTVLLRSEKRWVHGKDKRA